MNLERLSVILKNLRELNGYSTKQVEMLSKKKISNSYISLIETNKRKPSAEKLKILGHIYSYNYLKLYELAGYVNDGEIKIETFGDSSIKNITMKDGFDISDLDEQEIQQVAIFLKGIRANKK